MARKLAQFFFALLTLILLSPKLALAQTPPSGPHFEYMSKPLFYASDSAVSGDLAYIAASRDLYILNIASPESPTIIGSPYHVDNCDFVAVDVSEGLSYVAQALYSCTPRNSLFILDVSDPEHPRKTGEEIPTGGSPGGATELDFEGGFVYLAFAQGGLRIVEVGESGVPGDVWSYTPAGVEFRDVKARGSTLYLTDANKKIWVLDVTNKAAPEPLDTLGFPNHATGIDVAGNYAYVSLGAISSEGNGGLAVVDISDPRDISQVGEITLLPTPEAAGDVEVEGNYAFVADDQGTLFAFDISDPANPELVESSYDMGGLDQIRSITVSGDLILSSNLNGGLVILRFTGLAPSAPTPFLDLPWEIGQLTFERAALDPNSWFDHKYPLQDLPCCDPPVLTYTGETRNDAYRHHNGYDYGWYSGVVLNTPVQAAASGWATFVSEDNSSGAGNVIKIDHENGYQTWYEHLQPGESLVIRTEGERVHVNRGQFIGKVGMSGRTTGPHIHFSVFKDRDRDGSFVDEFPYGATDPLGWEGEFTDPWPIDMGGAYSFNLFIARALPLSITVPVSGATLYAGSATLSVPAGAALDQFILTFANGPFESDGSPIKSVVPSFFLRAENFLGQTITQFLQPIQFSYDYSDSDLSNIDENSLQFFSFNEQSGNWDPIPTALDTINNIATGETSHFSQFALMGRVKDLIAPTTEVRVTGDKGEEGWYRSNVSVELIGEDNEEGIGLHYTLYTLDGSEWFEYEDPIIFTEEGRYTVTYQSFDKAENIEERKTVEFNIDKSAPDVLISASPSVLWPPNGKKVAVTITGFVSDSNLSSSQIIVDDEYDRVEPPITGFNQTIFLEAKRNGNDLDGRLYTITVSTEDLAGNIIITKTVVIVPHDSAP